MPERSFLPHYESMLAAHYTWMAGGDYEGIVASNLRLLERLCAAPHAAAARALDLGCGSGFQSAALHRLGFTVTAVDLCAPLIAELRARNRAAVDAGGIRPATGDLLDSNGFRDQAPFEVAVCMGDTLTHLQTVDEVGQAIAQTAAVLAPHGRLVLRFRDLAAELTGTDRFIPVRADAGKAMICFLESDAGPRHVRVTDLVYSRVSPASDEWRLEKSSYCKLRIGVGEVRAFFADCGLDLRHEENERNLVTLVGGKA